MQDEVLLSGVTKVYGSGASAVTACRDISLRARRGEVTGILGPNGAGKSTVLGILCGVLLPSSGTVSSFGETDSLSLRKMTGFVSETPLLDPHLTVKETLYAECLIHAVPRTEASRLVQAAVRELELGDVLAKKVSVLSKGFAQRTSLARALCTDPKVLVLDEFSGGLDPAQIVGIRKLIQRFSSRKVVVLSTHHIDEALSLCTSLYIMGGGAVVAQGTPRQIVEQTSSRSLEEAFLSLTGAGQ